MMNKISQFRNLVGLILVSVLVPAILAGTDNNADVAKSPLGEPLRWKSTGPLIKAVSDAKHELVSIKDPTVVRFDGLWHVYATVANTAKEWNMVYLNFKDWSEAGSAKQVYMDTANPNFAAYHCAPQVFNFRPQKKWYLIYQSQPPTYSTTDDLSKPETWTKPSFFFPVEPAGVPKLWIDYWVICDDKNAYMFSSGDDGKWYRCQTKLEDFPKGFSAPVVILDFPDRRDLFEASCVYRLKGTGQYLGIIECIGKNGNRYFKSFIADRLDGEWKPLAATEENPFAGLNNMTYEAGVRPWTRDISHAELVRDGYDETLTLDPANLQLLYQGLEPKTPTDTEYSQLPYMLGLLRQELPVK